jgi:hypothetical protein
VAGILVALAVVTRNQRFAVHHKIAALVRSRRAEQKAPSAIGTLLRIESAVPYLFTAPLWDVQKVKSVSG